MSAAATGNARGAGFAYPAKLLAAAAVLIGTYREELVGRILAPLCPPLASAVALALAGLGVEADQSGSALSLPGGFAYELYFRCTGYLPVMLYAAALSVAPTPWRSRIRGLLIGVPALAALNVVRLMHLFLVGAGHPEWFDLAHGVLWEAAMAGAVFGLWLTWWARWTPPSRSIALCRTGQR